MSEEFFNSIVGGYLNCALWSSMDEDGEFLDFSYDTWDIEPSERAKAQADCEDFVLQAKEVGIDLSLIGMSPQGIGHDLWLTRNRHGAGFWDRGLGLVGERLSDIARLMGTVDIYVGDDGRLYFM